MASKHQLTGMTGLYLVAAELSKRGFIVSPTSRSALTADLLITDTMCKNIYAVQVKTNAVTFKFWLVGPKTTKIVSKHLVYAFVNLGKAGPEFYLVPSKIVAQKVKLSPASATRKVVWYSLYLKEIARFRDRWGIFKKEDLEADTQQPEAPTKKRRGIITGDVIQ